MILRPCHQRRTQYFFLSMSLKTLSISLQYVAPAFFIPKGMTLQQKLTSLVMNVVLFSSGGYILISLQLKYGLRKLKIQYPQAPSTSRSMLGSGYVSYEQALLRSVKSMHILYFLLDFMTITMLDNHVEYTTSLMKSALINFSVSSFITCRRSLSSFHRHCATGLALGKWRVCGI